MQSVGQCLFVLGGSLEGVCTPRAMCLKVPKGEPDSPLVPLKLPERIVLFLSEEEGPTRRETGPKVGRLVTRLSKCKLISAQRSATDTSVSN